MSVEKVLIVGGGIAGLTSAIALRRRGVSVEVLEADPTWSVYGVGIIQQANVVRAMAQLGLVDEYLDAAFGFDCVRMFSAQGHRFAEVPTPRLPGHDYPANLGVSRPALHRILGDNGPAAGRAHPARGHGRALGGDAGWRRRTLDAGGRGRLRPDDRRRRHSLRGP